MVDGQKGEPGEPGRPPDGQAGGAGGAGGRGGAGDPRGPGGHGGEGGAGAAGLVGARGPRGERGPVNRLAVIGYLILTGAVALAFFATWHNDNRINEARVERLKQLNYINTVQCRSLQNLYTVIRKTLHDADQAIDEIAYYRVYPQERARAHARNKKTMDMFRTPPCPPDFVLTPE